MISKVSAWWSSRRRVGVDGERGYLIVEAAMALPLYMLFMFAVLQISTFAIAQAKVTVAVNQTAVELSQYAYVMSSDVATDASTVIGWLNDFVGAVGGGGDITGSAGSENPMNLMIGGEGGDKAIAESMLRKHLRESDASLRSMGLVDGADGVRVTDATTVFSGARVVLDVEYELKLSLLLQRDLTMHAYATTTRWGK